MSVLIQMCFIHVIGGYVNVAQITEVKGPSSGHNTIVVTAAHESVETDDKTPESFLKRIEETCGGKSR